MRVWLYCICRNEERLMPYFLRHYAPWVERLTFFDGNSTDSTREIIAGYPNAIVENWPGEDALVDDVFMDFANERWKDARCHADYVIWVDADEFLYHPDMIGLLQRYLAEGVNIPQVRGFTMVSRSFPTTSGQIYDEVRTGFPDCAWDKKAIFRENMIWNVGRHSINHPALTIRSSSSVDIKLLHYRALGVDYVRDRHKRNWDRVPERCRRLNLGTNCAPEYTGHHSVVWFEEQIGKDWPDVVSL
jgi:hypothetical protein